MNNLGSVKTNFTAGQVSPNLLGRGDLKIYENGARRLENVIIHPTGGVSRRRGLKYICRAEQATRLLPFEFNTEQIYLLCLSDYKMKVFKDDRCIAELETPWSGNQLFQLNYTQSADTLLLVHPDVPPKQVTRNNNEVWLISDWEYYTKDDMIYMPYYNFYQKKPQLWASGTSGEITMATDADVFLSAHVGSYLKYQSGLVKITEVRGPRDIAGTVIKKLSATGKTNDWAEAAFSDARGWPVSVTFHQNRMVIGGSRDLPNRLWLSKSSDLFNFDLGKAVAAKVKKTVLPAGAGNAEDFANRCLNCNLCVQNCPMQIIKKADGDYPAVHIDYTDGFCDYDCRKCSEICPSGAIKRLTLAEKQKTQIGLAVINENTCIKCGLCVMKCPRGAISKEDGSFPLINTDECIGCGACQNACPVKAITVMPIEQQKIL